MDGSCENKPCPQQSAANIDDSVFAVDTARRLLRDEYPDDRWFPEEYRLEHGMRLRREYILTLITHLYPVAIEKETAVLMKKNGKRRWSNLE